MVIALVDIIIDPNNKTFRQVVIVTPHSHPLSSFIVSVEGMNE